MSSGLVTVDGSTFDGGRAGQAVNEHFLVLGTHRLVPYSNEYF